MIEHFRLEGYYPPLTSEEESVRAHLRPKPVMHWRLISNPTDNAVLHTRELPTMKGNDVLVVMNALRDRGLKLVNIVEDRLAEEVRAYMVRES